MAKKNKDTTDYDLFARFNLSKEEAQELLIRFADARGMVFGVLRNIEDIKANGVKERTKLL